jgi:protein-tyrosine phosphatase
MNAFVRTPPSNVHQHFRLGAFAWNAIGETITIARMGTRSVKRILFVCMGNICRSPTAEGVFRHQLVTNAPDLQIDIDSAGTHDYHVGSPPDRRSIAAAKRRGIDLSSLRARMVAAEDFAHYDLILAMDEENLQELRRRAPAIHHERIRLMMEFAPHAASRFVPDPYYGGAQGFEDVLDLLEEAAQGLLAELRAMPR